jgi:hypothetical protein
MTLREKNLKGIFTEKQIDMAYMFFTEEEKSKQAFYIWLEKFWGVYDV